MSGEFLTPKFGEEFCWENINYRLIKKSSEQLFTSINSSDALMIISLAADILPTKAFFGIYEISPSISLND